MSLKLTRVLPTDNGLPSACESETPVSGWWHKAFVFSSAADLPNGRIAYIDLDTVVVGDWSFLAAGPEMDTTFADFFLILSAESMIKTEGAYIHTEPHIDVSIYMLF